MTSNEAQIINNPEVFATTALALLFHKYEEEVFTWDPITLTMEMRGAYGREPEEEIFDRIMSAINVLTNNSFFVDLDAFLNVCNALNFGVTMSNMWVPADLDDVLWGVTEVRMLLGEDYNEEDFSHDIRRYVGFLLQQEGINKIPSVLTFAEMDGIVEDTYESYGGDAVMEKAFWDTQQEERDNLEKNNIKRLDLMMEQLSSLPIKSEFLESLRKPNDGTQKTQPTQESY